MGRISLEHSAAVYRADFVVYGAVAMALAMLLVFEAPQAGAAPVLGAVLGGLAAWTVIEYLLHRFVLHGLQPFQGWHAQHHQRPTALIGLPTYVSAVLFFVLVFLPTALLTDRWTACAATLGVLMGYIAYGGVHHATHHWRVENAWLRQRKQWHAMHHHCPEPVCFGVTTSVWDRVFRSANPVRRRAVAEES
jgi:cyclopropane-fatty-acyl-phospholipid synthase